MTDKVEVTVGENSVEVDQSFYRIATGVLTMGVPLLDVSRGDGFISVIFPDSESMEFFSEFLLTHRMFVDGDDPPSVNGGFQLEMIDGDLSPTYFINVDDLHVPAFEACLVSHTPSLSSDAN